MRLVPLVPFNLLLNYALGLTRISLRAYVLASAVCMLPGTRQRIPAYSTRVPIANCGDILRNPLISID